jgi:ABC-type polysaccharide/polyol phosphate transport system ATPase subunit
MRVDLQCDGVSKRYRVPVARTAGARVGAWDRVRERFWPAQQDFWALRDVSFSVGHGEAFGIIGRNGAGKSTMLKLLTGITAPTAGEIRIRGRIAALIEVGSGFHPELTGRENVFLSGSILGIHRREIAARLDDIVDFSGIGSFLDVPVKFYSSGMYVRLGFAIAATLEPDVLLIDEVLAVGDAEFQAKCLSRVEALKQRGVTLILVSHDLGAIEQLCNRAVLLERGMVAASGPAADVITAYQHVSTALPAAAAASSVSAGHDSRLEVQSLTLLSAEGRTVLAATAGEPLVARVVLTARCDDDVDVSLSFYDFDRGSLLAECATAGSIGPVAVRAGETAVDFVIPELLLGPGVYTLGVTAQPASSPRPVAWRFGRTTLYVDGPVSRRGSFLLPYSCRTSQPDTDGAYARSRADNRPALR